MWTPSKLQTTVYLLKWWLHIPTLIPDWLVQCDSCIKYPTLENNFLTIRLKICKCAKFKAHCGNQNTNTNQNQILFPRVNKWTWRTTRVRSKKKPHRHIYISNLKWKKMSITFFTHLTSKKLVTFKATPLSICESGLCRTVHLLRGNTFVHCFHDIYSLY